MPVHPEGVDAKASCTYHASGAWKPGIAAGETKYLVIKAIVVDLIEHFVDAAWDFYQCHCFSPPSGNAIARHDMFVD
eukprot:4183162-Pyramimonas_sp.AAC.1